MSKYRDSGMPPQDYWETLLDVGAILDRFGFDERTGDVAELGCGYGTFTVPLAARIRGMVHTFDIDPEMITATSHRVEAAALRNVSISLRDVFAVGFGLADGAADACLLFNILHGEEPVAMLREAARVVRPGGMVAVIHWRSDVTTPRGPALEIRPRPRQILEWTQRAGGLSARGEAFLLPPWHFGLELIRTPGSRIAPSHDRRASTVV